MLKIVRFVQFLLVAFATGSAGAAENYEVTAAEWAQPRQGAALVHHPALSAAVNELRQVPGSTLEIRYPGGDEGSLWSLELEAWLVALGIASEDIDRVPGSARADAIQLRVVVPAGLSSGPTSK